MKRRFHPVVLASWTSPSTWKANRLEGKWSFGWDASEPAVVYVRFLGLEVSVCW